MRSRDDVLARLRAQREEIARRFGVRSLALFGSFARDTATTTSDVDLLVDFGGAPSFDRYMDAKLYLEDLLERRVDLVTVGGLKPRLRTYVERELIRVA